MITVTGHTTRAAGTVLTAAIYNADHNVHITNATALNSEKLEGATPPVVDGHAAVFDGTSGAQLRTAGYKPADELRTVTGTGGLTGGGNLQANRTIDINPATQAEAEAGTDNTKPMTPLRTEQWFNHSNTKASQAEAEAGTDDTKWMTPAKVNNWFDHTNQKASQAEAEAGTVSDKWMSALAVKQSIDKNASPQILTAGIATGSSTTGQDSGYSAAAGGIFHIYGKCDGDSSNAISISFDGGSTYTTIISVSTGEFDPPKTEAYVLFVDGANGHYAINTTRVSKTMSGNIFIKMSVAGANQEYGILKVFGG